MLRLFAIFLSIALFSPAAVGQDLEHGSLSAYNVRHFTDENGLPQNSVKAITSDVRGNIWLATERGLARYDGNNFVIFDNFGRSFSNRNIASFHIEPGKAKNIFFAANDEETFIRIIDGKALTDSSFYRSQLKAQPFSRSRLDGYLTEGLPSPHFNHVTPDYYIIPFGFDRYYVHDKKSLTYYSDKKKISSIALAEKGFWGFFRLDNDLYHIDKEHLMNFQVKDGHIRKAVVKLTGDITSHPLSHLQYRYQIFWNNASNQAFILLDRSLYFLARKQNGDLQSRLVLEGFDFKGNGIVSIYFDQHTGRVLLGSQLRGLYLIEKESFKTLTTNAKGTDNNFYAQVLYSDSTVLTSQGIELGLSTDGKKIYSKQMQEMTRYVDWDKYSVLIDHQGYIWARNTRTLFKFDHKGKRLLAKWLFPSGISQLYQGKDQTIWIGTKELGLYSIDPLDPPTNVKPYLASGPANISWIQHQAPDTLWLATGEGLHKLSISSKKVVSIRGLEGIYVRSLYIQAGGKEVWVTTYKDGIFLFKNGKLTRFPLDKNKYLASAHCIIEDKKGFFWVPTNKGLFQIFKKDLLQYAQKPFDIYYYHHIKTAGFNTNEFNGGCQPCGIKLADEYVSLPSINGLVWFKPENIKPELPAADVYVESASANSSPLEFRSNTLHLSADANEVSLKTNIPYLGNPDNLKLSYRLRKDEEPLTGWLEINPKDPDILLPHLASGEYGLTIRKVNGFGANNYEYKRIDISVAKKWYESWWFRISAIVIMLALFNIALRARTKQIEQQKIALEMRVNERTRDLETVLKALGNTEKQLEQQLRLHVHMIASITHDIRTPVKYMGTALQFIQSRIEKNQTQQAVSAIQTMTRTIGQLDQLINNIVAYIKPEMHRHYNDFQSIDLGELVSERALIFNDMQEMKGGSIQIDIPDGEYVQTDQDLLGVILHNLIDNALKVAEGIIKVSTHHQGDGLHLVVADQGPGLPVALLQWLNTNDDREASSLPEQYNGLGFPMVKEISKLLRIRLYAENKSGAHIHLIFPVT